MRPVLLMLMKSGADPARARDFDKVRRSSYDSDSECPDPRVPGDLAQHLLEKIEQAATENPGVPPFEAYARRHRKILAGVVSKCARLVLPDGPAGIIVDFYCPRGGW